MNVSVRAIAIVLTLLPGAAFAQTGDLIVEKKTFELPSYTTVAGATIKSVKIGWESAGTLNADKSNAILITHYFSGTSHAFGKYAPSDTAAGYWDAIIGPGKAIDTRKYFVFSSDTLVNLNVNAANVVTTGPASINPDTGLRHEFSGGQLQGLCQRPESAGRKPRHPQAAGSRWCFRRRLSGLRVGGELS